MDVTSMSRARVPIAWAGPGACVRSNANSHSHAGAARGSRGACSRSWLRQPCSVRPAPVPGSPCPRRRRCRVRACASSHGGEDGLNTDDDPRRAPRADLSRKQERASDQDAAPGRISENGNSTAAQANGVPPSAPQASSSSSSVQQPSAKDDNQQEYADLEPEERDLMRELDMVSSLWIGDDVRRWLWYEGLKARRMRLKKKIKNQERVLDQELVELKDALVDLDTVVNVGMLDQNSGAITPAGWFVVFLSLAANVAVVYYLVQLFSNLFRNTWPA